MLQPGTALPSPRYVSAAGAPVLCGGLGGLDPAAGAARQQREGALGGQGKVQGPLVGAFWTHAEREKPGKSTLSAPVLSSGRI